MLMQGAIDEVLIWNRTLTHAEINALTNGSSLLRYATLLDGNYTWTLRASDDTGNTNTSSISFYVDTVPPMITFTAPANGTIYTKTRNISINFTVTDEHLNKVNLSVDLPNGSREYPAISGSYSATFKIPLLDGYYHAQVTANDSVGITSARNLTFIVNLTDVDNDGIPDEVDSLIGGESSPDTQGVSGFNVTVGGNSSNGTFSGVLPTLFTGNNMLLVNFTFNYSNSTLNMSNVSIIVSSTGIVVSIPGVLTKTLYLANNNFVRLCTKDAPISSISEISAGCDQEYETDMTTCINNGSVVTYGNYTCLDNGTITWVAGLFHSGLIGTQAPSAASGGGSRGGSFGGFLGLCWYWWLIIILIAVLLYIRYVRAKGGSGEPQGEKLVPYLHIEHDKTASKRRK